MQKTFREQNAKPESHNKNSEPFEAEAEEITAEHKSRLRRHEMVEFSDLYLSYDDELKQERGQDW